jgi:hypothetical protein
MSKELPYFKFSPGKYLTGDITICDLTDQGVFINICCHYWLKQGGICLANVKQRFRMNEESINRLLNSEIIKVDENDKIVIEFLDEQLSEFMDISQKRSEAGVLGGKAKAKQLPSKSKANDNILREEKRREDNNNNKGFFDSEKLNSVFKDFLEMRKKIKKPATPKAIELLVNKLKKLSPDESTQIQIVEQSILSSWQDLFPLKQTYGQKNETASQSIGINSKNGHSEPSGDYSEAKMQL